MSKNVGAKVFLPRDLLPNSAADSLVHQSRRRSFSVFTSFLTVPEPIDHLIPFLISTAKHLFFTTLRLTNSVVQNNKHFLCQKTSLNILEDKKKENL